MSDTPPTATEPRRPPPDPGWRERVDAVAAGLGLDVPPGRVIAATVGALAVVALVASVVVVVFVVRPSPAAPSDDALPFASSGGAPAVTPTSTADIVVQAAGAVVRPGVYRIASTARVNDLVWLAGGFAPDGDPDQVELAAPLSDGERVYVPRIGEAPPPSASGSTSSGAHGPIDLNHATEADLESLPGIGPALAQSIIDYRTRHGGFHSVDELADVRGIGPAKLDQLRPLVKV